jgi:hypothetical protein
MITTGTSFLLTAVASPFPTARLAYNIRSATNDVFVGIAASLRAEGKHFQHLLPTWQVRSYQLQCTELTRMHPGSQQNEVAAYAAPGNAYLPLADTQFIARKRFVG